jgi:hypothetical protein
MIQSAGRKYEKSSGRLLIQLGSADLAANVYLCAKTPLPLKT